MGRRGGLAFPAKESPDRVRSPSGRRCHVLAGQARTLPGFRARPAGACERERRAEVHLFPAAVLGLVDPIRSNWSCRKRRRLAWSRAEPFRTCSSRAGLEQGWQVWQLEGGAQSTARPIGRSGPSVLLVQGLWWGKLHPQNWVPAAVTSRLCTSKQADELGSGGQVFLHFQL